MMKAFTIIELWSRCNDLSLIRSHEGYHPNREKKRFKKKRELREKIKSLNSSEMGNMHITVHIVQFLKI